MPYKLLEDEKEVSEILESGKPIDYFKSDGKHAVIGIANKLYVTEVVNLNRLENKNYSERTIGSETGLGSIAPVLGLETESQRNKSSYYKGLSA